MRPWLAYRLPVCVCTDDPRYGQQAECQGRAAGSSRPARTDDGRSRLSVLPAIPPAAAGDGRHHRLICAESGPFAPRRWRPAGNAARPSSATRTGESQAAPARPDIRTYRPCGLPRQSRHPDRAGPPRCETGNVSRSWRRLLPQPAVAWRDPDEVGLGKTIEAGLVLAGFRRRGAGGDLSGGDQGARCAEGPGGAGQGRCRPQVVWARLGPPPAALTHRWVTAILEKTLTHARSFRGYSTRHLPLTTPSCPHHPAHSMPSARRAASAAPAYHVHHRVADRSGNRPQC